jgi:hypothetical protein
LLGKGEPAMIPGMLIFNTRLIQVLALLAWLPGPALNAQEERLQPQHVTFKGDDGQMLLGDLWKPDGDGPFPALVWIGTSEGDGHAGFAMNGEEVWGADVLDFLERTLAKKKPGKPLPKGE